MQYLNINMQTIYEKKYGLLIYPQKYGLLIYPL